MADSNETLHVLARAQLALATSISYVLEVVRPTEREVPSPLGESRPQTKPVERQKPRRQGGRKPNELDEKVIEMLESRPGTSVAELERELNMPEIPRSRLEWSLRRLLERGQIVKTGNTCGARYSTADSQPMGQSSSLRVVGS